jgi:hypothetical protein
MNSSDKVCNYYKEYNVTVGGHRRYRRSYNSLFSMVLTGLRVTLLTGRSLENYIFSSGGDNEDIVSL